ncbi:hypothetical protein RT723_09805 [Psychrosphaera aquimarina]|uniref:Uncharacterized protein n=1 Tax=Psychrosphaera aquimarina TaxID=2044854 RepID=A0ABU3R0T8_9GAMM|nr:hypothetical protein [Psychrosphaera aquimarina]MDU0113283.1 hypothetical protein [Psychrosphaera aquimarina]
MKKRKYYSETELEAAKEMVGSVAYLFKDFSLLNNQNDSDVNFIDTLGKLAKTPLLNRDEVNEASDIDLVSKMTDITLNNCFMENLTNEQKLIVEFALENAYLIGSKLVIHREFMNLSEPLLEPQKDGLKFKELFSEYGGLKGKPTRAKAYDFINKSLSDNPNLSINRLAESLEADSNNQPDKYGKAIPLSTCKNYARAVKNSLKR